MGDAAGGAMAAGGWQRAPPRHQAARDVRLPLTHGRQPRPGGPGRLEGGEREGGKWATELLMGRGKGRGVGGGYGH